MEESIISSVTPGGSSPEHLRRRMWMWVGGMVGSVVFAAALGGVLVKLPYVALMPGSARDTEPLVALDGVEGYPSEGELLLTTVRVRQKPNFWEYLFLQVDDDVDVLPEELILGDRTPDENRERNQVLMNDSKTVAVAVALEELGYDAVGSDGVYVVEVVSGSAAEAVLELGDVLVSVDGKPVVTSQGLGEAIASHSPGDEVLLGVEKFQDSPVAGDDGQGAGQVPVEEVSVRLGEREDDPSVAFLGVGSVDRVTFNSDVGFEVDIDSGSVGGPSAGLAFTLAVLDLLTEGELTGGARVAVTGTIGVDGVVGSVGGVKQKTAAVRDLGADVFIVPSALPAAELEEIMEVAGDTLTIEPVDNLDQALAVLASIGGDVGAVEEFAAANSSEQS